MVESIGFSDMLSLAQTIGIVGTMILTLYFSKRQLHSLSIDQQTRVLNDLDEKMHKMAELVIERPTIQKVIDKQDTPSEELAFSFYVLWVCAHAYAMRQRNVLNDNDWIGWIQWMRNCFQKGTITEIWKQVESEKWFNPDFQKFINREILDKSIRT
jgi:hypothetical protein